MSARLVQLGNEKVVTLFGKEVARERTGYVTLCDGVKVPGMSDEQMLAGAAMFMGEFIVQEFADVVTGTIEGEIVE